jgi:hypothetical protein
VIPSLQLTTDRAESRSVPLSHVSIELGHLHGDDLTAGMPRLAEHFSAVAPYVAPFRGRHVAARPRVSCCYLIDDYFGKIAPPAELIPALLAAADEAGVTLDYIARESGCAEADGVSLAGLVEDALVDEPPPSTTGSRPPARETGWLSNGERSPTARAEAFRRPAAWQPPLENGDVRHSIFVDVEMWKGDGPDRQWACATMAAVWQLSRLGLLRYRGDAPAAPVPVAGDYPADWRDLPPVIRVNPAAESFFAYRTVSVLPRRELAVEHAVETILEQVRIDPAADEQVRRRADAEGVRVPQLVKDRISYVFLGT